MKKSTVTILTVLIISAAVVSGALVVRSLPPKIIVQNELLNKPIINSKQPAAITLPQFVKPDAEVTLIAVGDIMLSRSVEELMVEKNDFALPFKPLANITSGADITFGNLETAILPGKAVLTGEFNFRADPKVVAGLKLGGFDILSLANNHTPNFGQNGLISTFNELNQAEINFVGAGLNKMAAQKPTIIEKQGIKFGFLAYVYPGLPTSYQATPNTAGVNVMDLSQLKVDIENLKPQVDFVIVSMHAGTEYDALPDKVQTEFAHTAITAGGSLVIGHHPHVVQTFEKYQHGYIIYSLGNFIFDQLWSTETRQGLMAKILFLKSGLKKIEFIPIKINSSFQPELAASKTAEQIINRLKYPLSIAPKFYWDGTNYLETINFETGQLTTKPMNQPYQAVDLDGDGRLEEAVVVNGVGYLIKNNHVLWQTDPTWQVENVLAGDFNNDGKIEVGFSLWKLGSYGPDKPFWEIKNDPELSNHLFLFQFIDNSLKMIWGSSALDYPIREMKLVDLDHDQKNELAVVQSQSKNKNDPSADLAIWQWHEFNFVNLYKSQPANYFDLKTDLNYIYLK